MTYLNMAKNIQILAYSETVRWYACMCVRLHLFAWRQYRYLIFDVLFTDINMVHVVVGSTCTCIRRFESRVPYFTDRFSILYHITWNVAMYNYPLITVLCYTYLIIGYSLFLASDIYHPTCIKILKYHDMKTFSLSPGLCERNPPVTSGSPVEQRVEMSMICNAMVIIQRHRIAISLEDGTPYSNLPLPHNNQLCCLHNSIRCK